MGKFYGAIGYAETNETSPGVWTETITEHNYSGDVLKNSRRWQAGENLNDDLTINNLISILADPFAYQNFHKIRYIKWMGASWKVTSIEVQRPRLILTIGGVYNGQQGPTSDHS
jgi:hypothetical protein